VVKATSSDAAQQAVSKLLIKCQFCPAKIGVDAAMTTLTQQG
jgi:hypothetical protein